MHRDSLRTLILAQSFEDFEVSIPVLYAKLTLEMHAKIDNHAIVIEERVVAVEQKYNVFWCFHVTLLLLNIRIRLALRACQWFGFRRAQNSYAL